MTAHQHPKPVETPAPPFFIGVDVGGTNIKIGLVDHKGQTLAFRSIPTEQPRGPQDASARTAEAVRQLIAEAGIDAGLVVRLGLATPGPMDIPAGRLQKPGNLPTWHGAPMRQMMQDASGMPVTFANDANAAAYGEFWHGAGERFSSIVMLTLGTGVGGGIIINDVLVEGSHSNGGEIGHIIIDSSDEAPLNSLGIRGTLEGYCGAYGVVRRAQELLADRYLESSMRDSVAAGEELTPLLIANAAEAGDSLAMRVVNDTARYLAIGAVTCVHMLDPEAIVIGGAMTFGGAGHSLGERFLDEVRLQARERMIESLRDVVAIEFAKLGGDAGYLGAAGLARREHFATTGGR